MNNTKKLNVFCLWVGNKYSIDYVINLRNMLKRHLTIPYEFICLTDKPLLHKDLEGIKFDKAFISIADSWCKLSLFVPQMKNLGYEGMAMYLDLDVVIVKNIDDIVEEALKPMKKTVADKNEYHEIIGTKEVDFSRFSIIKDWWRPTFNSSFMIWEMGYWSKIYMKFKKQDMDRLKGDQDLITEIIKDDERVRTFDPKVVQSYKANGLKDGLKKFTKIAVFHGEPKPHKCDGWVKEHWY